MATKPMFLIYEGGRLDEYVPPTPKVYGVSWDGSSTTEWTRTDDAADFPNPSPSYMSNGSYTTGSSPFDNIMPWSGMVVSERTGGTMVAIPKFWYKWTKTGNAMKIQISSVEQDGFSVSPAHMDRGLGEKDVIYVGRYFCGVDTYKSTTGVLPQTSKTRSQFRTEIRNLGSNIYQIDYAVLETIWMLYLVEFANWDSQSSIGGGGSSTSYKKMNMGYTDSMTYHTGTTASSIAADVYGGTQYRNIEGLWDNVTCFIDGIATYNQNVYIILNPDNYADTTSSPAVNVSVYLNKNSGYISSFDFCTTSGYTWFLYPSKLNGSASTYTCEYYSGPSTGQRFPVLSSYNATGRINGLFATAWHWSTTSSSADAGSRIVEYPS